MLSEGTLAYDCETWPWPRKADEPPPPAVRVYTVLIPYQTHAGTRFRRVTLPLLSIQGRRQ